MNDVGALLQLMANLRDPQHGCPWDLAQTYRSIVPHTLEEAYEVADAVERGDLGELRAELGDLLLQVVFYSQLASEEGVFSFNDVVQGLIDKLVRRHPHVFGDTQYADLAEQAADWERIKRDERHSQGQPSGGLLADVPLGMPGLTRAVKLTRKAARVGFDWDRAGAVLDKIEEEIRELRAEIECGAALERLQDELGDVLFATANLARHLDIDPEQAVRGTNAKFERRFRYIEECLAAGGRTPRDASLEEMDRLWNEAKVQEP
ncbi:nucleoside triphosphate pyrophosphohydrolase [Plasticicumulans acidivorans]|uniref:Nucleoside triphosphate pyrophosphohydrolase n=1 Tax=Plasticicumulans acidivorans TaxID=886464 RepID=A0A317N0C0_9GAMM|nr:nucleoside triphosphate pyrophosphohydrolase [Plasticicumulans acidivorans]PWV65907.1 tetrapyrrole methylase family protein/MazG family protein/ATP diphosphatase [Plasticicumulans acidivorans]